MTISTMLRLPLLAMAAAVVCEGRAYGQATVATNNIIATDYLGVHPEALIRGRHADPAVREPAAEPTTPATSNGAASKGSKP